MIVIVEIIAGRLMRDALIRQGCQLATKVLGRNKAYLVESQAPI